MTIKKIQYIFSRYIYVIFFNYIYSLVQPSLVVYETSFSSVPFNILLLIENYLKIKIAMFTYNHLCYLNANALLRVNPI